MLTAGVVAVHEVLGFLETGIEVETVAECSHIAGMVSLTIRNVPEELHTALKERARRNRRSLNQQVIEDLSRLEGCFSAAVDEERKRRRADELIGMVDELRSRAAGFMTAEEIDAAIEEGRT